VATASPTEQELRDELARILASARFVRNERQSQFLRFLVEGALEGRHDELKESVIGVEVFGRAPGYDPKTDGVVRTEAIRLRDRLEKYYAGDGILDPLVIDLPKGGYRPVFRYAAAPASQPVTAAVDATLPASSSRSVHRRRVVLAGAASVAVLLAVTGVWWWRVSAAGRGAVTIAVLPLENVGDDSHDHFAEGLTDELISDLSVIEGVTVRSRTSSYALQGKRVTARDAGRQLDVRYLVEGSVRQLDGRLRVNLEVIDASDDTRVSSLQFDRKLTDVFTLQEEISRAVVNGLRLQLIPGRRRYDTNLDAWEMYLRGRHEMASFPAIGRTIGLSAVRYFDQAIEKDARFAIAYAGKADALLAMDENISLPGAYMQARDAAARALALDPMLSDAYSTRGALYTHDCAWSEAEADLRHAITLNPNNALAHLRLATMLVIGRNRPDDAAHEAALAVSLDPLSPYVTTEAGRILLFAGRYAEAIVQLRKSLALDQSRNRPFLILARALSLQGKPVEAVATFDGEPRSGSEALPLMGDMVCVYRRAGRQTDADTLARKIIERETSSARARAVAYTCSGDITRALEEFSRAIAGHEPRLADALRAPELSPLRSDPRAAPLLRQLNLGL